MRASTSAEGSTSVMFQPFEVPTSMYSMKRSTTPVPRKRRAIGTISPSLVPRLTTMLTLIGASPAACAAKMPSSTSALANSASFMRRNRVSSSASRLTVTRVRPASRRLRALRASSEPLVVSVRSSGRPSTVSSRASRSIRNSRFLRSSGSPPVMRIFSTPCATKRRATRSISSCVSSALCGRNG